MDGRAGGRGPENVGHGRATAGVPDGTVAGRTQRPVLDAGQAPGRGRDGPVHPASGADVRGHQTAAGRQPWAAVATAQGSHHRGPIAAGHAKGERHFEPC